MRRANIPPMSRVLRSLPLSPLSSPQFHNGVEDARDSISSVHPDGTEGTPQTEQVTITWSQGSPNAQPPDSPVNGEPRVTLSLCEVE